MVHLGFQWERSDRQPRVIWILEEGHHDKQNTYQKWGLVKALTHDALVSGKEKI